MSPFNERPSSGDDVPSSRPPFEEGEQMEINDTNSFNKAIDQGRLKEAAAWLEEAKKDKARYDANWVDHRSRRLMHALCVAGRLDEAKKYVNYAETADGRRGRQEKIDRWPKES